MIYTAFAGGLAFLADGLMFGWAHPFDLTKQIVGDRQDGDATSLSRFALAASMTVYLAFGLAVLTLARVRAGKAWRQLIGWAPWAPWKTNFRYWLIAGGALLYSFAANALLAALYPPSKDWFTVPSDRLSALLMFCLAVIFAPFAEELLFRGWLYTNLRARLGVWISLVLSSAIFSGLHYEDTHLYALVVFPIGIALGVMRETTGSLKASISFHAFFNAVAYGLAVFEIG